MGFNKLLHGAHYFHIWIFRNSSNFQSLFKTKSCNVQWTLFPGIGLWNCNNSPSQNIFFFKLWKWKHKNTTQISLKTCILVWSKVNFIPARLKTAYIIWFATHFSTPNYIKVCGKPQNIRVVEPSLNSRTWVLSQRIRKYKNK